MLAHHVLFWLKDDATEAEVNTFHQALKDLEPIAPSAFFHVGTPANIERDVIDASYSFSLFAAFETMEQFETYQKHPQHIEFLNGPNKLAKRVLIYDAD
ncbi:MULTISPECIES: Dabb family protein [Empedobacter]|uniref:Dabb family protein n=1 Tax=Empedobacter falsenii TaxID=343874 RepID=A0A7H9DSP6_9FLAO|nr:MULTISPECIES: Dabb family protein [Empedobacter]MDH1881272.1 Dabb family protein [Empedobacter sp. GD03797]QLL58100.1 Dabb family protein [Empedobacter falsenii]